MSISEPPSRLAVQSLDDLVGLVPYLIGFHPHESLVVLVIEAGRVRVTARVDLAAVLPSAALTGLLVRIFDRFPSAEGWFLAYTDDPELAWPVLDGCANTVGTARLGCLVQVGAQRWWADHPGGPSAPVRTTPAAAAAVVLGLPARASRQELADLISGPDESDLAALADSFAEQQLHLDRLGDRARRRLLQRLLRRGGGLTRSDAIRLALLVASPDGASVALRGLSAQNADQQVNLWSQVLRHCPTGHQSTPLGILGLAGWQSGDGALATICLERLDLIDPDAPLAALLDWLNQMVVPPGDWPDLRPALLRELRNCPGPPPAPCG